MIKIKKENKGKFTEYARRKGLAKKGGGVTNEAIEAGLKSKDPKIRKRAQFAKNARKWNKKKKGA